MDINVNPASSQTQTQRILAYMLGGGRITSLEALNQFQCFRLASRISDIRNLGYEVQSQFISTSTAKKVKQYWIATSTQNNTTV